LLFPRRDKIPLRAMNHPSSPCQYFIAGRAAMSNTAKSGLTSVLQPFSDGGADGFFRIEA